jgi:hypothetical protein
VPDHDTSQINFDDKITEQRLYLQLLEIQTSPTIQIYTRSLVPGKFLYWYRAFSYSYSLQLLLLNNVSFLD